MAIAELIERVKQYNPDADVECIERAYYVAKEAHRGQFRDSGEAYFQHPFEVAKILADLELDPITIAAGLLHDVLEDTDMTTEQLEEQFGPTITLLVDGVTKLSRIPFRTKEEQQAQSLRKMFLAMAQDVRVVLIKLADRLHNMRTLRHLPVERQKKIARETLEIYTPLAHRLGMWSIKWEMEDLAFRYLEPEAYYNLVNRIAKRRQEREGELAQVMHTLKERLAELGINAELQGRPKHFYSIYQKMVRQGKELDEIYDLMAVRIIVDTVKDCYGALGLVHTLWKPVPGRFKDYVAMPKSNMYQSLHTTVIGPQGDPFEIQIRTWEMHRVAERGIAAHWLYKEGAQANTHFEEKVAWLRQVMDWLREMRDPHEFMETLKIDLFEDEVFVFTPKGDVKSLPAGATPVDFAFSVHTDVGLRCAGAKVNGRIVPLDYKLSNGEIVEIITTKTPNPSSDWLRFIKTSKARSKIRAWLKEEYRAESIARGREIIERELKKLGVDLKEVMRPERQLEVVRRYGFTSVDDLLAAVGYGKVTAPQVLSRLLGREEYERRRKQLKMKRLQRKRSASDSCGVRVKGIDDLLIRLSKCCSPVPGDEIIGYITRGRGLSVHRRDCPNILALNGQAERCIEVEWDVEDTGSYPVEIAIEARDRVNLLSQIMNTISSTDTNITAVNARTDRHSIAHVRLVVDIQNVEQMYAIMARLRTVEGVFKVHRATPT